MADNYYGAGYRQSIANAAEEMIYGPRLLGSISYGPYQTVTFTDYDNYRVTIQARPGSRAADGSNENFHLYSKPVSVTGMSLENAFKWMTNNPTANSINNPATRYGTPNDATPGSGFRHWIAKLTGANNDVYSYVAINELTGEPVIINVTESSHILKYGAVIQIVRKGPDGKLIITRYGIGEGGWQDPDLIGEDFLINQVWNNHYPKCFPATTLI